MCMQLERPLVMMLSRQLQSKSISPDDMSRPEFTLPPMLLEARFQVVVFINRIHSQSQDKISRQAFEASRSLYEPVILALGIALWLVAFSQTA